MMRLMLLFVVWLLMKFVNDGFIQFVDFRTIDRIEPYWYVENLPVCVKSEGQAGKRNTRDATLLGG